LGDGSILVVEMFGSAVTLVSPDGSFERIAEVPGGPNGAAIGPGGDIFVADNGARFTPVEIGDGRLFPGPTDFARYMGGRIVRVDAATGAVEELYDSCDGHRLVAPNDLVFDRLGGFYFTDHGMPGESGRISHLGGIYYAKADGSFITEAVFPAERPNGIGISPDGNTLYWSETPTGRVIQRRIIEPGVVERVPWGTASECLYGLPGLQTLDSLALEEDGSVCVATLIRGGITVISPDGEIVEFVDCGDRLTTNICFGGDDLRTAYVTLGSKGQLVEFDWPRPGLRLPFERDGWPGARE
jgi:gluconolactonase